jgi:hypothetical protein
MLHKVITLDPTAVNARISLARVCEYRGKKDEGIEYARRALQFAKELGRADKVPKRRRCSPSSAPRTDRSAVGGRAAFARDPRHHGP